MNMSNTCDSAFGAMPMPLSCTLMTASPFSRRVADRDPPAMIRVLRGVVEQVGEHLGEAHRIAADVDGILIELDRELVPEVIEHRPAGLDRRLDDVRQFEGFLADLDDTASDA